jgi:hypothetical protein
MQQYFSSRGVHPSCGVLKRQEITKPSTQLELLPINTHVNATSSRKTYLMQTHCGNSDDAMAAQKVVCKRLTSAPTVSKTSRESIAVSHVENVRPYLSFDICRYTLLRSCSCSAVLYCYNWSHCKTAMPCYPYPSFSFLRNLFICLYSV